MATAYVQNFGNTVGGGGVGSTQVQLPLGGVAIGNIVVIALFWNTPSVAPSSVTDDATIPNAWTLIPGTLNQAGTYCVQLAWAYIASINGGTVTATAHFPSGVDYPAIMGAEFSGLGVTPIVDQSANIQGTGVPASPSITTLYADEVVFGAVMPSVFSPNMTAGTGWTLNNSGWSNQYYISEWQTPSSVGTFQATTNPPSGLASQEYRAAIASFSAGGPPPPPPSSAQSSVQTFWM